MKILHIDCSPRLEAWSRKISSQIIERLQARHPGTAIARRDLGVAPLPHTPAAYANALSNRANYVAALETTVLERSEEVIKEIEMADIIVVGTPMNNFTVPSNLKSWIDLAIRMGRTLGSSPSGKIGLLKDRPVLIGVSSGDTFHGERANQPDFLTPYLSAAFGCIGLKSVHYFPLQATAHQDDVALLRGIDALLPAIDAVLSDLDMPVAKAG